MLKRVEIVTDEKKLGEKSDFHIVDANIVKKYRNRDIIYETLLKKSPKKKEYLLCIDALISDLMKTTNSAVGIVLNIKKGRGDKPDDTFECINLLEISPLKMADGKDLNTVEFKSLRKINDYIVNNSITVISNDVPDDIRFMNYISQKCDVQNFMGIPLISSLDAKIRGIFILYNTTTPGGYTLDNLRDMEETVNLISLIVGCLYISRTRTHRSSSEDKLKDRFLVTMSHEIRTPLNGIMGMVTMLGDAGPLNKKQSEYVRNLTECVFQLSNLMNNILDFSKMTSNRFFLLKQPFNLFDVVDDAFKMIEGGALVKGIKLIKELPNKKTLPILVGDPQRIIQVLCNLLNNAIKFTEIGHVTLKINAQSVPQIAKEPKKINISVEVEDSGVGIPWDEQVKIFEVFHQASTLSTYMSRSGTGLGLSIVRELVRLMGGKVSVKSTGITGEGSVFSFNIILEEEINISTLSEKNISIFKGAKILLVDDRPEIRLQLAEMLMKWGCIPFMASSAEEGLKYISGGLIFDTILVDICMPHMSGVEMAQKLKELKLKTPLIGISSVDLNTGEEYFDVYMYKPVNQNQLFSALLKCLTKNTENSSILSAQSSEDILSKKLKGASESRPSLNSSRRKKRTRRHLKILVAEDENHNAFTITEMLRNLGYRKFERVSNGKECVERTAIEHFDVILMDIIMPIMDGIEATKCIKERVYSNIPCPYIIAVSAAVMNSDKDKCQFAGIDAYLSKPLTKEKLDTALSPLVKLDEAPISIKSKSRIIKSI